MELAVHVDKRGGPHDIAWGHAKPIDVACQKTECKYFGSESLCGGISHPKVHLGGGDPKFYMEAWPKVSHEIKAVISGEMKNSMASMSPEVKGVISDWAKSLTASRMKKSQGIHIFSSVLLYLLIDFIL